MLSLITPALAQPATTSSPVTLTADHIQYGTQTGEVAADGQVRVSGDDTVITADHLAGNLKTGDILATGNVTLTQAGRTAAGSSLAYNYRTRVGRMEQVLAKYGPWTVKGETLQTSGGQGVATNTSITPCNPQNPAFLIRARKLVVVPNDYLTAYTATLFVYGVAVATIPQYTTSLKPNRRSGPSIGYNTQDGFWVEYSYYFPIGDADNQLRFRYGTVTGISGEDILSERFRDHTWSLHLGRVAAFDQNGNLSELDQYSLDLVYDRHRIADWPVAYDLQGHVGRYVEHLPPPSAVINAIATREEGSLNLISDTMSLSPSMVWSWSTQARGDLYDTGQYRTVLGYAIAVTDLLDRSSSVTLAYNFAAVTGTTPFSFDSIGNDSNAALSYVYSGVGLLQSGGVSVTYSFLSQQTTLGANVGLAVTDHILLSASVSYNLTTQTYTETDYALNIKCDCLSVGVLYRTFPQIPAQNAFYLTIGLTAFPETFNTAKF